MFFSKPKKKNNSVLHWEKQQKAKISQKSHCCIFGTCKDVLANGFFVLKYQHLQFGSPTAVWFIPPFVVYGLPAPHSLTYSQSYQSQGEPTERGRHWYAEHTVTLDIGHCWRTVLCMYLSPASLSSPIDTHISHVAACGSLGWQVVLALKYPATDSAQSHWPQEAWHLQRASSAAKGSRSPVKWRMHLYLLDLKEMDWNLSLRDKQWIAVDRHFLYECNLLCHYQFMFI